jgi:hypothetical protein
LSIPDDVPEPPAEPITRPGDLWLLESHRLLCGDATVASDVAKVMDGRRATLRATDPPYLVGYDGGNHPQTWANGGKKPGAAPDAGTKHWDTYVDHDTSLAFYEDFLRVAIEGALTQTPVAFVWISASPQVTRYPRTSLSRWRYGFEARWGCSEIPWSAAASSHSACSSFEVRENAA